MTLDYNLMLILFIAVLNAYTAWMTQQQKKTIALLEKNTNSIKDALVASTAKASLAEGKVAGRAEARQEDGTASR